MPLEDGNLCLGLESSRPSSAATEHNWIIKRPRSNVFECLGVRWQLWLWASEKTLRFEELFFRQERLNSAAQFITLQFLHENHWDLLSFMAGSALIVSQFCLQNVTEWDIGLSLELNMFLITCRAPWRVPLFFKVASAILCRCWFYPSSSPSLRHSRIHFWAPWQFIST